MSKEADRFRELNNIQFRYQKSIFSQKNSLMFKEVIKKTLISKTNSQLFLSEQIEWEASF